MTNQQPPLPNLHELHPMSGELQYVPVFPARGEREDWAVYLTPTMRISFSEDIRPDDLESTVINIGLLPATERDNARNRKLMLHQDIGVAAASFMVRKDEIIDALTHKANTDALTGLANRRAFKELLELRLLAHNESTAVMFLDLDHFKRVNDDEGHETGDNVLVDVAQGMTGVLKVGKKFEKSLQLRENDVVCRLGGDEFALIINTSFTENKRRQAHSPEETAEGLKNRLVNVVDEVAKKNGVPYVGASIGYAIARPGDTTETLLKRSDAAMYIEKQIRKAGKLTL
jgi:diguanylate cyclase (GGDEF)-like protein